VHDRTEIVAADIIAVGYVLVEVVLLPRRDVLVLNSNVAVSIFS
jgi:hypothetical protein